MAKRKAPKSWAEQLADLEDPAPKGSLLLFFHMYQADLS